MSIVEETITNDDGVEQTYYVVGHMMFSTEEDALQYIEENNL